MSTVTLLRVFARLYPIMACKNCTHTALVHALGIEGICTIENCDCKQYIPSQQVL